jgi:hypothetical protein
MRSTLFEDFDKRAQEVRRYFIFLKNLEQGSIQLSMGNTNNTKIKPINNDLEKTLKATGFLLLYNLVESTMRNAIETIFDELKTKNISFDDVRDEIKKIVIDNLKDKDNKSTKDILVTVQNISVDIISATFNRDRLFSGNIDGQRIKDIAEMYGFSYKTNARKTGNGKDLQRIKDHRKDLTHGFKSFEKVGRDATSDELLEIQKRVICYLRGILENIESYLSNEKYLKKNPVKNALIKDGWTITIDTCPLEYEDVELYPDLAIEKIISENQKQRKIIVEITSFISSSLIKDFQNALGQYILYRNLIQLSQNESQEIYLAVKDEIYETFFQRKSIKTVVQLNQLALVIINTEKEEIVQWIN